MQPAFLHQDHGGHRDQRLGHGIGAEDRILGQGRIGTLVAVPDGLRIGELSVSGDHDDGPGQLAAVDLAAEGLLDPFQPFGRQPDLAGLGAGQGLCPCRRGRA